MEFIKKSVTFFMDTLESVAVVGSIFIVIYLFIVFPTQVQGSSMEPNIQSGDRIITSKITYKLFPIKRGDIVVVHSPKQPGIDLVKRVIALEGDRLSIQNGQVFLNGKKLEEDYIYVETPLWFEGYIKEGESITVPDDHAFIMGDNRPRSSDSREFGPLPLTSVVGKAIYRYFPLNKVEPL